MPDNINNETNEAIVSKEINDKDSQIAADETLTNLSFDPEMYIQWHIKNLGLGFDVKDVDMNVEPVWLQYQGKNIRIGVIDDGFAYNHPDLKDNYMIQGDYDSLDGDYDSLASNTDFHGTWVAGVISAVKGNNIGGAGIAPKSKIYGFRMGFGLQGSVSQEVTAFEKQFAANVDVSNSSWGYGGYFYDNFFSANFKKQAKLIEKSVMEGRNYKGMALVFAAGNDRSIGQNVNYHSYINSRYTIAVAAISSSGNVTSFSTPGAAILVSAPGQMVHTTNKEKVGNTTIYDYKSVNGTSFAAPNVSGAIALMLEANSNLGYRDIQEIIAYTSRKTMKNDFSWQYNGSINWNGGGLHNSHDYGYGLIDTTAAVRLSETWDSQNTSYNERKSYSFSPNKDIKIKDLDIVSDVVDMQTDLMIDQIEVLVNFKHDNMGDLVLSLISPSGTTSVLVDRPGLSGKTPNGIGYTNTVFTLSSTHFWGESSKGKWTLVAEDMRSGSTGLIKNWSLGVFGDVVSNNNTYIYTDEYATELQKNDKRGVVSDTNDGFDTLNFSAVSTGVYVDLNPENKSVINGKDLKIAHNSVFERVYGTVANDTISGNQVMNFLWGGQGEDYIYGGGGDDFIVGGPGNDTLVGGIGKDRFIFEDSTDFGDMILDFHPGEGGDVIDLKKWRKKYNNSNVDFFAEELIKTEQNGQDVDVLYRSQKERIGVYQKIVTLKNVNKDQLCLSNFDL